MTLFWDEIFVGMAVDLKGSSSPWKIRKKRRRFRLYVTSEQEGKWVDFHHQVYPLFTFSQHYEYSARQIKQHAEAYDDHNHTMLGWNKVEFEPYWWPKGHTYEYVVPARIFQDDLAGIPSDLHFLLLEYLDLDIRIEECFYYRHRERVKITAVVPQRKQVWCRTRLDPRSFLVSIFDLS